MGSTTKQWGALQDQQSSPPKTGKCKKKSSSEFMNLKTSCICFLLLLVATTVTTAQADKTVSNKPSLIITTDTICGTFKIKKYQIQPNDSTKEEGLIIKRRKIQCEYYFKNEFCVFSFGDPYYSGRLGNILGFICRPVQPDKLFNGHYNKQRVGIWLHYYPWGALRKATEYEKDAKQTRIYFRPNGKLLRTVFYDPKGKVSPKKTILFDRNGDRLLKGNFF
jgi:antitoxin component YwqK of YwqJK toxin-antitoxin module